MYISMVFSCRVTINVNVLTRLGNMIRKATLAVYIYYKTVRLSDIPEHLASGVLLTELPKATSRMDNHFLV